MEVPIKIYTPSASERHHYTFNLIFNELLGIDFQYVNKVSEAHINYSNEIGGLVECRPFGILEETTISPSNKEAVKFTSVDGIPYCYQTDNEVGLPYDIFSATFFLVSRYEEYLPFTPDDHNRFPASSSVLVEQNVIEEPLVNLWTLKLKELLERLDSTLSFNPRKFEFISTLDIDQAWKFKNKGLKRHILGTFRDLIERKWENFFARWPILLGIKQDPFFQFEWHRNLEKKFNFKTIYFILLGDYGTFDKNIDFSNSAFRTLINQLGESNDVGIHPSYASNVNKHIVLGEIKRLQSILKKDILVSRQHFLMHSMPQTYRVLADAGIREEHTMGYSTHIGFRAGIASSFDWFDLSENKPSNLRLYPFCSMDITPLHYRKETPQEAIETNKKLIQKVKSVGGLFVSLWHNESLSETERWKGWRKVYESMIQESKKNPED